MAINLTDFYIPSVAEFDWSLNSDTTASVVPTPCRLKSIHIATFAALDSAITVTVFIRPAGGGFVTFNFVIPVMDAGYYELDFDTVLGAELELEAGDRFNLTRSSTASTCFGTYTTQLRQDRSR